MDVNVNGPQRKSDGHVVVIDVECGKSEGNTKCEMNERRCGSVLCVSETIAVYQNMTRRAPMYM